MDRYKMYFVYLWHMLPEVLNDGWLGDGHEGLHEQRIQARTGQLHLTVQGWFEIHLSTEQR